MSCADAPVPVTWAVVDPSPRGRCPRHRGDMTVSKPRLRERARYWFDNTMSKGTSALIAWLALASAALVLVITLLAGWLAPNDQDGHFGSALWTTLMRAMDAGTIAGDSADGARGHVFLTLMLVATIGGIFIV